jgi:hypothetical protein
MTLPIDRLLPAGRFRVGCNYWASHAGAHMWSDWQPATIAEDFQQLKEAGLTLVRVFPLWPDFQPLHRLCINEGDFFEYRHGEDPLPDTPVGRAGMDARMLGRFRILADEAHRHGLQLIVGLVTGWMSGRLFTPPAFTNLNVITDPEVLRWQARFVRCFIETLRDHPAIVAWDLGNECNVMGRATPAQSWLWTHTLATAIRAADPTRPVVSGMHSLEASPRKSWAACDQGELTDVLTTHPYPLWTRFCDQDPITSLRPQLHATTESLYYAGLGGKPCFAEEMGSMGPFIISDELTPRFLRPSLYSLWAHDCRAMMWWCAYDQAHLWRAPYDWVAVEQELGLHRTDRSAKPVVQEIREFTRMVGGLPFDTLPPRIVDAVCLLSEGQDSWAVAQSAFALAKLAGADLSFHWLGNALPESPVYLLPGLCGTNALPRRRWLDLLGRVKAGATLYVSLDTAVLADLEPVFGVTVSARRHRPPPTPSTGARNFIFAGKSIPQAGTIQLHLQPTRATVHAWEDGGNPTFFECPYGEGRIFLLTQALETTIAQNPGTLGEGLFGEAWRLYSAVFASVPSRRVWKKTTAEIGVTEHPQADDRRIIILVNHSSRDLVEPVQLADDWQLAEVVHGSGSPATGISLPLAGAAVLQVLRR